MKKEGWTEEEDLEIVKAHAIHGNSWSSIAKMVSGRPANSIKNHWCDSREQERNNNPPLCSFPVVSLATTGTRHCPAR